MAGVEEGGGSAAGSASMFFQGYEAGKPNALVPRQVRTGLLAVVLWGASWQGVVWEPCWRQQWCVWEGGSDLYGTSGGSHLYGRTHCAAVTCMGGRSQHRRSFLWEPWRQ